MHHQHREGHPRQRSVVGDAGNAPGEHTTEQVRTTPLDANMMHPVQFFSANAWMKVPGEPHLRAGRLQLDLYVKNIKVTGI